jgi:hypothetical protein
MSTCLPPLFRPPNPPPDLQLLITEALGFGGPAELPSLLDLHLSNLEDAVDNRFQNPIQIQLAGPSKAKNTKGVGRMRSKCTDPSPKIVLNITSVRAPEGRGEHWEGEVLNRVGDLLGVSIPAPSRSPSPTLSHMSVDPFPSGYQLPPTQPLGESSLAAVYARPLTHSPTPPAEEIPYPLHQTSSPWPLSPEYLLSPPVITKEELSENEENHPPMPPASQNRVTYISSDEEEEVIEEPFHGWGGSRAEGNLPFKWSSAEEFSHSQRRRGLAPLREGGGYNQF